MNKELLEKELRGFYKTGCFHIYLAGSFEKDLSLLSQKDLGTFLHEYIHFLQNISTPYGIFEAVALNEAVVETFIDIQPKKEILLPYDAPQSVELKRRMDWLKNMNGQSVTMLDGFIQVDEEQPIMYGFFDHQETGIKGRHIVLEFHDKQGKKHHRFIGALDIKEAMAAAYQSLIDPNAQHPDIPYNLLRIFCEQTFPSVGNDIKKFICLCYTALFSLEPAFHFFNMCQKAENEKDKTGFQFFDEYLNDHKVRVRGKEITPWEHFNNLLVQYSQSIQGLIRCETPYIDSQLEQVRLENGNVPLLNILKTDEPFTVENVSALVSALGIPFLHAENKGWVFPALDGEAAEDVVQLVGTTWLYQFLINTDPIYKCVCPLVSMCEQIGDNCYDKPWLKRGCLFEVLGDEIGLKDKQISVK